ncbi:MAG: hypothetical protein ACPGNS_05015 [Candidatus Poseidoniaceae archaeon]
MDIFELAKKAKKVEIDEDSNEELKKRIGRLERKVSREKSALQEAERTIEETSRNLYLANQDVLKSNRELSALNEELSATMSKLTSAELRRKSVLITLGVAMILFIVSEFAIEPILEVRISNNAGLILAKLSILGMLIPIEIITSKILESRVTEDDEINEKMYLKILEAAYEDGVVTDMERSLLKSSAKQLGVSKTRAVDLESTLND